jgi:hypothetical protein
MMNRLDFSGMDNLYQSKYSLTRHPVGITGKASNLHKRDPKCEPQPVCRSLGEGGSGSLYWIPDVQLF